MPRPALQIFMIFKVCLLPAVSGLHLPVSHAHSDVNGIDHRRLVFDIGMNRGDDTANYIASGYQVVAVEANPVWSSKNSELFKDDIHSGRLRIVNAAISDELGGTMEFFVPEVPEESAKEVAEILELNLNLAASGSAVQSETPGIASGLAHLDEAASTSKEIACFLPPPLMNCPSMDVTTTTCKSLIELYGVPHYLKIDIEGFDGVCMTQLASLPCKSLPEYISFEEQTIHRVNKFHANPEDLPGNTTMEIMEALGSRGYSWKVSQQDFAQHSKLGTGPFGEAALDYVKGSIWSTTTDAFVRTPDCWKIDDSSRMPRKDCDVHGKLDRDSCTDL